MENIREIYVLLSYIFPVINGVKADFAYFDKKRWVLKILWIIGAFNPYSAGTKSDNPLPTV